MYLRHQISKACLALLALPSASWPSTTSRVDMCWKCDAVEVVREPMNKQGRKIDTWYWFGVAGLCFMLVTIFSFVVGMIRS